MRTLTRAVRGILALAVLAIVLGGVPWLLIASLGVPWPQPVPTGLGEVGPWLANWRIDRAKFVLDLLGIVGWGYWAAFVRQLVVQVPGAVADAIATARHTAPAVRTRRAGPAASFVAVLLATLAMSIALSRSPAAAKTGQSTPPAPSVSISAPATPAAVPAPTVEAQHTVAEGDTLWGIAADQLGDAQRWHEIYELNNARVQDDGRRLEDPNVILPGWTLSLPATSAVPPPPEAAAPAPAAPTTISGTSSVPRAGQEAQTSAHPRALSVKAYRDRTFVELPDGGLVGISLAGALAAFIALARKRRRIRSTARWPIPLNTPKPTASAPVAAIERAHLATLAPPALGYIQDGDLDSDDGDDPYLSALDVIEPAEPSEPANATPTVSRRSGLTGPSIPSSYAAFTAVGGLAFGTDGNREVRLDMRAHAGLGLSGPGAADAARALFVGIAANGGPLPSLDHMRILMPTTDLETVLNGALPYIPRLEVTEDLDAAVDRLEAEYLDRRRMLSELSVRDAASVRRFYPDHTFEPLVLIATPETATTPRLAALLEVGRTVDLHAVLLGVWDSGTSVDIDAMGCTSCGDDALSGATAFMLSAAEAEALLAQLRDAEVVETPDSDQQEPTDDEMTTDAPRLAVVPAPHGEVAPLPVAPRVSVNILGSFMVLVDDCEVLLNNKETSVLLFLALHPNGATRTEIIDALWTNPDGTNTGTPETLRSTLHNARDRIRAATGDKKKMYIAHRGNRYMLEPADVTTDIARFHQLLATANRTQDAAERVACLEDALDCYQDHVGAGIFADWLIIDREAESRRFGDACARLADLVIDTRPEFALYVLERAVADADCNQELYAKIMEAQARLGRFTEMWKTLRLLEVRLAALEDEPDQDLYELANRLAAREAV